MANPSTADEWITVARERGADAKVLLNERPKSIASVYMVGYSIECAIKAYLRRVNRPFPKKGREGHNLKALWKQAGWRLHDLSDPNAGFFIENWSTDLRYEAKFANLPSSPDTLILAAQRVVLWIQSQMKRAYPSGRLKKGDE